jgi:hypothetical protein
MLNSLYFKRKTLAEKILDEEQNSENREIIEMQRFEENKNS